MFLLFISFPHSLKIIINIFLIRPAMPARPSHRTAEPSASAMVGGRAHVRSRGTPRSAAATSLSRASLSPLPWRWTPPVIFSHCTKSQLEHGCHAARANDRNPIYGLPPASRTCPINTQPPPRPTPPKPHVETTSTSRDLRLDLAGAETVHRRSRRR